MCVRVLHVCMSVCLYVFISYGQKSRGGTLGHRVDGCLISKKLPSLLVGNVSLFKRDPFLGVELCVGLLPRTPAALRTELTLGKKLAPNDIPGH